MTAHWRPFDRPFQRSLRVRRGPRYRTGAAAGVVTGLKYGAAGGGGGAAGVGTGAGAKCGTAAGRFGRSAAVGSGANGGGEAGGVSAAARRVGFPPSSEYSPLIPQTAHAACVRRECRIASACSAVSGIGVWQVEQRMVVLRPAAEGWRSSVRPRDAPTGARGFSVNP